MKRVKLLAVLLLGLLALGAVLLVMSLAWAVHGVCWVVVVAAKWLDELERAFAWLGRDLCNTARGWMKWALR